MESGGEDCEKERGLGSHFTIILGNLKFLKVIFKKFISHMLLQKSLQVIF